MWHIFLVATYSNIYSFFKHISKYSYEKYVFICFYYGVSWFSFLNGCYSLTRFFFLNLNLSHSVHFFFFCENMIAFYAFTESFYNCANMKVWLHTGSCLDIFNETFKNIFIYRLVRGSLKISAVLWLVRFYFMIIILKILKVFVWRWKVYIFKTNVL